MSVLMTLFKVNVLSLSFMLTSKFLSMVQSFVILWFDTGAGKFGSQPCSFCLFCLIWQIWETPKEVRPCVTRKKPGKQTEANAGGSEAISVDQVSAITSFWGAAIIHEGNCKCLSIQSPKTKTKLSLLLWTYEILQIVQNLTFCFQTKFGVLNSAMSNYKFRIDQNYMPFGRLSKETIEQARDLLREIK